MIILKELRQAEFIAGNSRKDRKDYIGVHIENKQEFCEHFPETTLVAKIEIRQVKDWGNEDFTYTENTAYLQMFHTRKKIPVGDFTWEYADTYVPKSKPIVTAKSTNTAKPTTTSKPKAKTAPRTKPTPKKEAKYGFVEFLAEFFTEWSKRRAV